MSAQDLLTVGQYWLWIGGAVAAVFLLWGIDQIDEDARGAYVFRPLLVTGILLLWPVVLWRWWQIASNRDRWQARHHPDRALHGRIWAVLGVLLPLIVLGALALRQTPPEGAAVQLEAAE
ncbi:MAG: hypothetical protein AAF913_05430 [Pseudomonadota bacterium]